MERCGSAANPRPVFDWQLEISDLVGALALELQGGLIMERLRMSRQESWEPECPPALEPRRSAYASPAVD